jgi:GTP cyclohydrolase IB
MEEELPDIQQTKPSIEMPIRQVGVENLQVPFKLESKYGGTHEMLAKVSIRTDLGSDIRGISMSRLLLTLKPYLNTPLKSKMIKKILLDLKKNLNSKATFIKFEFNLPIDRKSPITDNSFPIFYKCRFEGQLYETRDVFESGDLDFPIINTFKFFEGMIIQYASYCPCSAELCQTLESGGFPHNQRSFANILVEVDMEGESYVWLEDIIEAAELRIKTLPYPIIKRSDEKEIARIASENPLFVEDAVREISVALNDLKGIKDWIVKCIHEESIHTSDAIAVNWKGIPRGLHGTRFI